MAIRVGFVWSAENVEVVHNHVGLFMMDHQIVVAAIPPFFVLMALTTVVARVIAVRVRASRVAPVTPVAVEPQRVLATV